MFNKSFVANFLYVTLLRGVQLLSITKYDHIGYELPQYHGVQYTDNLDSFQVVSSISKTEHSVLTNLEKKISIPLINPGNEPHDVNTIQSKLIKQHQTTSTNQNLIDR